jgi:hypothetical protein
MAAILREADRHAAKGQWVDDPQLAQKAPRAADGRVRRLKQLKIKNGRRRKR